MASVQRLKELVHENREGETRDEDAAQNKSPNQFEPVPPHDRSKAILLKNLGKLKALGEADAEIIRSLQGKVEMQRSLNATQVSRIDDLNGSVESLTSDLKDARSALAGTFFSSSFL